MNDTPQKVKLDRIARNIPVIKSGIIIAINQVQEVMSNLSTKNRGKIFRGRLRCSSGKGNMIAYDHYVEYCSFKNVGLGLGYSLRDWVYSHNEHFKWRVAVIPPDKIRNSILTSIESKTDGEWFIPRWPKGNPFGQGNIKRNQLFPFLPVVFDEDISSNGFNANIIADGIMKFLDKTI